MYSVVLQCILFYRLSWIQPGFVLKLIDVPHAWILFITTLQSHTRTHMWYRGLTATPIVQSLHFMHDSSMFSLQYTLGSIVLEITLNKSMPLSGPSSIILDAFVSISGDCSSGWVSGSYFNVVATPDSGRRVKTSVSGVDWKDLELKCLGIKY